MSLGWSGGGGASARCRNRCRELSPDGPLVFLKLTSSPLRAFKDVASAHGGSGRAAGGLGQGNERRMPKKVRQERLTEAQELVKAFLEELRAAKGETNDRFSGLLQDVRALELKVELEFTPHGLCSLSTPLTLPFTDGKRCEATRTATWLALLVPSEVEGQISEAVSRTEWYTPGPFLSNEMLL